MQFDFSDVKYQSIQTSSGICRICNCFATVDIETSTVADDITYSYQQGLAIFNSNTDSLIEYCETRDINDLVNNIVELSTKIDLKAKFIIFVHKLSYDITYFRQTLINKMADHYKQDSADIYSELLTGKTDWLSFKIKNIEFRCSYKLTQMSLYTFTKTMGVTNRKLLGANDYGIHYSDEELSDDYHNYMYNDTVGLGQAICKLIKVENMTLATLPYTATGFVRQDIMKAFRQDKSAILEAKANRPNPAEFKLWTEALSGGLAQVNKLYKNKIITNKHDVTIKHRDFVSFYPSLMLTKNFPILRGVRESFEYTYNNKAELNKLANYLRDLTYSNEYLIIAVVDIFNYNTVEGNLTFLPAVDKLKKHINDSTLYYSNKVEKNEGVLRYTLSTPDLRSIYEFADTDLILPVNIYKYKIGRLPEPVINTVKKYFTDKSIVKEKIKEAERNNSNALLLELSATYSRAKSKLNSCAGMMMQKPMQDSYEVSIDGTNFSTTKYNLSTTEEIISILDDYYGKHGKKGQMDRGRCLSLLNAVFITAWARYELLKACNTVGFKNVLYVDTDSLFYISTPEIEARIAELNKQYRQEAIDNNAYVTFEINGKQHTSYLNHLEDENQTIIIFKALSAKRYMYYTEEKGLKLTCSSIMFGTDLYEDSDGNANYRYTREMEVCGFNEPKEITFDDARIAFARFKNGLEFNRCSTKLSRYVTHKPEYMNINGHMEWVENGTIICSSHIVLQDFDIRTTDDILDSLFNTIDDCEIGDISKEEDL